MASKQAIRTMEAAAANGAAETVAYTPAGGAARNISAMVDRAGREEDGHSPTPSIVLTALNDATYGMESDAINAGGDQVAIAEDVGGSAATRYLRRVVNQDSDWVTVEVG